MDFIFRLFDPAGFPARWQCGAGWSETPWLGWLHIVSDLGVWSAYLAIPLVLIYFILRRSDLPFRRIFVLFGAFILACGTTHLMEAIIFWWPVYRLAGVIKLFTAIVSWATVFALIRVVPRVLTMRSPKELEREINARQRAEVALQEVNAELEQRVEQRTADLTRAMEALREERELLQITLGSIGDGVIVTDTQGNVTFLNGVAETLTGWKTSAANGLPLEQVFRIINEQSREPVENPALRALRDGVIVGLANHTLLLSQDGTERPIDDSAAPIRGEVGVLRGAVLVFRDITQRKQTEDALLQSQLLVKERAEELETVLRIAPTPIWISHDTQCLRVTGNQAAYRLTEIEEGSNVSATAAVPYPRKFVTLRHGKALAIDELPLYRAAMRGEEIEGADLSLQFEDGHVRHLYGNATPIRDREGSVRGAVAALMDITELKNSEQALKEADRRKDEFLAILAHELRNPLAPIRNSLELMKRSPHDTEVISQSRAMMERQLGQMVRLVDDLIDVSRISRNKLELRREKVELASVIHHAIDACRPLVESNKHELKVALTDEPIYLDADAVRLAQVLVNLLTNACKYTNPGGRIWLSVDHAGSEAVIRVKDTGIGIPPAMLEEVFEMFTQIDRSMERAQSGLGIGLMLVKRLVEMHSGQVIAQSEGQGHGSEFVIRLPVIKDEPVTTPPTKPISDSAVPVPRRILVVDDNRDAAMTLSMLLKIMGNELQIAHDGEEAVAKAESFKPAVILLDIGLPKLNGYDACRAIREQPGGSEIFIVALTGWGQEEDRRKSKAAGFDHHLVKPVDHAALRQLLAEFKREG